MLWKFLNFCLYVPYDVVQPFDTSKKRVCKLALGNGLSDRKFPSLEKVNQLTIFMCIFLLLPYVAYYACEQKIDLTWKISLDSKEVGKSSCMSG